VDPDPVEIRVLGCLVEKQRTTPDAYPLTLNSLRLACNQSTNRDPVVDYGDSEIRAALERLGRRGWTRMASWGGRSVKYRHLLGDALGLSREQVALLAVLMLRGPQTPGELKGRSERLHTFGSLAEVRAGARRARRARAGPRPAAPAGPEGRSATSSCSGARKRATRARPRRWRRPRRHSRARRQATSRSASRG